MSGANDRAGAGRYYRAGVATAFLTSFLTVWTTIVRDDGNGAGFFLVIMAAGVGAFSAWFDAAGMARTMAGVAAMQMCLGVLLATAPSIANTPDGSLRALSFSGVFVLLWLASAALFRAASRRAPRR